LFHFFRDEKRRWGYSELREGWERNKERALHQLSVVRENAALYDQRKAPGMPGAAATPTGAAPSAKGTTP
jgi:hypothetical protein